MAGAMRKAMVYLGLVEEDDRYDYEGYDDEGYDDAEGHHEPRHAASRSVASIGGERQGSVATMPDRRPAAGGSRPFDRITTIHPRTYNEAKQIGESFRESTPVIMNLSDMDDSDAKRLVDFAAGLVFGLRGTIERVTNKVFLLSPSYVEVIGDDKKVSETQASFFNQS